MRRRVGNTVEGRKAELFHLSEANLRYFLSERCPERLCEDPLDLGSGRSYVMNLGVYIENRLFQRGELVYCLRVKTPRGLGLVVVDVLVGSLRRCFASRSLCVKEMSSVLRRRGFYVRSERSEDLCERHDLVCHRFLGCILLRKARHDSFYGSRWKWRRSHREGRRHYFRSFMLFSRGRAIVTRRHLVDVTLLKAPRWVPTV